MNKKEILEWVRVIVGAIVIALMVMFFIKPTIVKESSMEPNFYEDDYLLVSQQSYKLFHEEPERGDVIIFKSHLPDKEGHDKLLIKRVIGLPGEKVDVHDGKVYINGEEIDDSYTNDLTTTGTVEDAVVPKDEYFVLGDNRKVSVDSRYSDVGFVPKDSIVGKVVFRLMPFRRMGIIHNPYDK